MSPASKEGHRQQGQEYSAQMYPTSRRSLNTAQSDQGTGTVCEAIGACPCPLLSYASVLRLCPALPYVPLPRCAEGKPLRSNW